MRINPPPHSDTSNSDSNTSTNSNETIIIIDILILVFLEIILYLDLDYHFVLSFLFNCIIQDFAFNFNYTSLNPNTIPIGITDYPITPEYSEEEFPYWAFPPSFLQQLWNLVSKAPRTTNTNSSYFMTTFANSGFLPFAYTWLCSLSKTTFPTEGWALICTDLEIYSNLTTLTELSSHILYLPTEHFTKRAVTNRQYREQLQLFKLKICIGYQILLWNVDAILADLDITFFDNPLFLFDNVTDIQFQCDSRTEARLEFEPGTDVKYWSVNAGFMRIRSTPVVKEFVGVWFRSLLASTRAHDQDMFQTLLYGRVPMKWITETSFIADISSYLTTPANMTLGYLDPVLVANCGGVFNDGQPIWIEEAKRRNIQKPVLIHFFHLSTISQKFRKMKNNNLLIVAEHTCPELPDGYNFPLWKNT